jgi:hypothetical protein
VPAVVYFALATVGVPERLDLVALDLSLFTLSRVVA